MYTHYGRIGDIWKHVPLVNVLSVEAPAKYVETNSSRAEHPLTDDWRRDFGIGHFLRCPPCASTLLARLETAPVASGRYRGSPALAMHVLGRRCAEYTFCDCDASALADIEQYAARLGLRENIRTLVGDSRACLLDEVDGWGPETLVHIDPYEILEPDADGHTYAALFERAARRGVRLLLWYGYVTTQQRNAISAWWSAAASSRPGLSRYEVEFADFASAPAECNPGVWGCGIVAANLSVAALDQIAQDHDLICRAYASVTVGPWEYRLLGKRFPP